MAVNEQFAHLLKITAMSDEEWIEYIKGRRNLIDMCSWYEWQEMDFENALENDDFSSIDSESDPEYVKVRKANKVIAEKRRNCVQLVQPRPPLRVPRKQRRIKKDQDTKKEQSTKTSRVLRPKPPVQPKEVPYTANLYKKVIQFHHRSIASLKSKLETPCSCNVPPATTSTEKTENALVKRKRPQFEQFGCDLAVKKLQEHYAGVSEEETVPVQSKKRAKKNKNIDSQSMAAAVKAIEEFLQNQHDSDDTDFSDDSDDSSLLDALNTDFQQEFYAPHSDLPDDTTVQMDEVISQTNLHQTVYGENSNEYILPQISSDLPVAKRVKSAQNNLQKFYVETSNEYILPQISSDMPVAKIEGSTLTNSQKFCEEHANEFALLKINSDMPMEGMDSVQSGSMKNFWGEPPNSLLDFLGPQTSYTRTINQQSPITQTSSSHELMDIYRQLENIESELKQELEVVDKELMEFE